MQWLITMVDAMIGAMVDEMVNAMVGAMVDGMVEVLAPSIRHTMVGQNVLPLSYRASPILRSLPQQPGLLIGVADC